MRLREVRVKGRKVWAEVQPEQCAAGHAPPFAPGRGECPACGAPLRVWDCRAEGCAAPQMIDYEHTCPGSAPTS